MTHNRNTHKRLSPIDYTSREQQTLRDDLDNYARNYYPNIYNNFSENSFESLMLDLLSYGLDNLHLNLDYQANEALFAGASEFNNIRQIGKQHGYKYRGRPIAFGEQSFYAIVPASTTLEGPDVLYFPTLKRNTQVLSNAGGVYTLVEDLNFTLDNDIVVAEINASTGLPTSYAIKAKAKIASGDLKQVQYNVGNFERFLKIQFDDADFSEIVSVFDSEGNQYYEVEHLTQNVVYRAIPNIGGTKEKPQSLLRPFEVPRRFVTDFDDLTVSLQFGMGQKLSAQTVNNQIDPSNVAIQKHGKTYISSTQFDPTNLISGDKLGIVPTNTTLFITYRANTGITSNAAVGTITEIIQPIVEFQNREDLDAELVLDVVNSFETQNEYPVVGEVLETSEDELKHRIYGNYAAQNRAVTPQDYVTICYKMPATFGSIKRVNVMTDPQSAKRNLNLFVISEDSEGNFIQTNKSIKQNLKIWLNQFKMINDTIDILDAKIVNFGLEFDAISDLLQNSYDILERAYIQLQEFFAVKMDIGEPINITEIYKTLRGVEGLIDVTRLRLINKNGGLYSTTFLNFDDQMTNDGRFVVAPKNVVFEMKYPNSDIRGNIQ